MERSTGSDLLVVIESGACRLIAPDLQCQRVRDVGMEEVRVGSGLFQQALPASTLVVAIDPGKVTHRVWCSTGDAGLLEEPRSVPSLRPGLDEVTGMIRRLAAGGWRVPLLR